MISDFKHYFSGAAKFTRAKIFMSSTETSKARVDICNSCDLLDQARRCTICSCFVDQKAKYKNEFCPLVSVEAVSGTSSQDTVTLENKWRQTLRLVAPTGFARIGDVIAMPRHTRMVNLRTNEPAILLSEPSIL